jgi:glycosyltransferase involved in cell wall biosynthesis
MEWRIYRTESPPSPTWHRGTIGLPVAREAAGFRRAWQVFRNLVVVQRAIRSDEVIIFSDDLTSTGNLYGLLQRGPRRPTIVRTDPFITTPRSEWKKRFLRACLGSVDRLIAWAPAIAERYHECLGLPREKMVALHYNHSLSGYQLPPATRGDYLFSGGDSMRDYPTLLEAVRGLPIPVRIATRWRPPVGIKLPDNVILGPTSPTEFRVLLAGARLAVFPLRTDSLRTSGQQSYLNAMALAKPVVVTDPRDAPYYIEDGKTGRLVPSGDATALREAIAQVLDAPQAAREMGERAQAFALPLDQEYTWSRVLAIAQQTHRQRQLASGGRQPPDDAPQLANRERPEDPLGLCA